MKFLVLLLVIVLILVIGWFAFGNSAPMRPTRRIVRRPPARRVVRRRSTVVEDAPDVIEERRIVE